MEKSELQIVVSAKDEASAGLAAIGASTENLTKSVFTATAAWNILEEGIKKTVDFLKDSVGSYLDAQKKIDLTSATIRSLGGDTEKTMGQLKEFGDQMVKLGLDGEGAALAAAKLGKAAGGDTAMGMQLAKKAADLAASGFGDFESNIDNLTRILAGKGQRALMEYRINLSENATTGEQLNAVFGKITQTSEQFADTIPGQIAVVKRGFDEFKQTIGESLVVSIINAVGGTNDLASAMDKLKESSSFGATVLFALVNEAVALAEGFILVGKGIATAGLALNNFAAIKKGDVAATESVNAAIDDTIKTYEGLKNAIKNAMNPAEGFAAAMDKIKHSSKGAAESAKIDTSSIANANTGATESVKQHAEAVDKLKEQYSKLKTGASHDLAELSDNFKNDMASINGAIARTQQAIQNLTTGFNRQATSDAQGMAEKVIDSEKNIASLRIKVANEVDTMKRSQLQQQLEEEQKNYDSSADFRRDNAQAITEAERRSKLTNLQREYEDYRTRRTIALEEYTQRVNDLSNQLAQEQQKKAETVALYNERRQQIRDIMIDANAEFQKLADERMQITLAEVTQEIKYFQDLAAAIASIKTSTKSALSHVSIPVSARAEGGPVSPYMPYLVGEEGPEMFVPSSSGRVIPNNALQGSSGGIVVNLSGTFYTESQVATKMGNQIAKVIGQQLKIRTV